MKIGIDLDEVLADFSLAVIKYHNLTYGTKLRRSQFLSYGLWKTWGGTKEEATQKLCDFYETPFFKNVQPVSGARKAISVLKQNNDLFIVTSRQNDIAEATQEWINKYFPDSFRDIYFANNYFHSGVSKTKAQICDEIGVDILIEDALEYALECVNPKRKIFLLDCPWNQQPELPQSIQRFFSWDEIVQAI